MENREIAKILQETANLLEIDGADIGRYRSYEKAAQLIENLADRIEDLAKAGTLTELPGIGDRMAAHIQEILQTGKFPPPEAAQEIPPHHPGGAEPAEPGSEENGPALEEVQGGDSG